MRARALWRALALRPVGALQTSTWCAGLCGLLAGCASPVTVMPLATGQVQVQAYELRGTDSQTLRQEAARLCAGAGDVLRESAASHQPPPPEGRVARWGRWLGDAVMPPERHAQLVVRCAPQAERSQLSAAGSLPGGAAAFTGASATSDRAVPYGY